MPDVTVVIPTHDRARLLVETLHSVLGQRGVDLEVLVVDDGSTDGTSSAARSTSDPRVRVVRHERALGVSAARNHGIEAAWGQWVAFLDDDDLWSPDKLAAQLSALGEDARLWAATGAVSIDGSREVLAGEHPLPPQQMVTDLRRYNSVPVGASNVVAERALLTRVGGFDPNMRHMSDWEMWIRLGAAGGLPAVVDRPLVGYRLHAQAATMDTALDPIEPLEEFDVIARRHAIPADRAAVWRWIAWTAMRRGHRGAAVRAYAGAVGDGDLRSLLRIGVALVHPGVGKRVFFRPFIRRGQDEAWLAEARDWLRDLASA